MCVHGSQAVYCTTELCLSVDKLKEEGKNNNKEGTMSMLCTFCQLLKLRILTLLLDWRRLFKSALSRHHSSVILVRSIRTIRTIRTIQDSKPRLLRKRLCSQSIQMFREEICGVVLRVTRLTDRRFSHTHCCMAKHRVSMCLSQAGPLRCRMSLAESASLQRRNEVP